MAAAPRRPASSAVQGGESPEIQTDSYSGEKSKFTCLVFTFIGSYISLFNKIFIIFNNDFIIFMISLFSAELAF